MLLADAYVLGPELGRGAAGIVYEARHRDGGRVVALKTLKLHDAEFLYLLKREFRALTDLNHPNLVTLHALVVEEDLAFITMERVEGVHWLEWVRPHGRPDATRIRHGLTQLVNALHHLHAHGLVHRDVKPSNVMVVPDGTVKLLDFGLAFAARAKPDPSDSHVAGTLDYLSPEQARGQPVTGASDWYALGVMLHEALAGRTPWRETDARTLLRERERAEPELLLDVGQEPIAEDLDMLCLDLRLPEPELRPSIEEILRRLGAPAPAATHASHEFVGRSVERQALASALDRALQQADAPLLVVGGHSGAGKSAMCRALLDEVACEEATVVLRGQCFERETVRYSGVDALVDALRSYLLDLEPEQLDATLAGDFDALAVAFPVLDDLLEPDRSTLPDDPLERQRAANNAFTRLIEALTQEVRLVLFIDDLHWCSQETARLILHLLRTAPRGGFAILATHRSDMGDHAPSLTALLDEAEADGSSWRLDLRPLPYEDARALAAARLGVPRSSQLCDTIARESGGNPLFIEELARHAHTTVAVEGAGRLGIEAITQARIRELAPAAVALLRIVALAGGPIAQRVAFEAAQSACTLEHLAELRARNFVRTFGPTLDDGLETYHGRVRLAVIETLASGERAALHQALASALERADADAEVLAFHFARSGQPARAVGYLREAARLAAEALAFARASALARQALDLLDEDDEARYPLETELGEALANDGRGAEAARAFLRAAACAPDAYLDLRRRAAEQFLRSGHTAEGMPLLEEVLGTVGLRLARGSGRALGSWLWQRAALALRGSSYEPIEASEADEHELLRVDVCWSAATGLPAVDVFLGQAIQSQHLRFALRLGEPRRLARALSVETLYAATSGTRNRARVDDLVARVRGIARELRSPHTDGLLQLASGAAAVYRGEFVTALDHLHDADAIFRTRCTGVAWERSFTSTFDVLAKLYLGRFSQLVETLERATADARARDDLSTLIMVRLGYDYVRALIDDRPDRARDELEDTIAWRPRESSTPTYRFATLMARGRIERYAGQHHSAYACFVEYDASIRQSMMLSRQPFLLYYTFERGSGALWAAFASKGRQREALLDVAAKDIVTIRKEHTGWGAVFVGLLEASHSAAMGNPSESAAHLDDAHQAAQGCEMAMYDAAARVRRAQLDGDTSHDLRVFTDQGVRAPMRMVDMHAPPVVGWSSDELE